MLRSSNTLPLTSCATTAWCFSTVRGQGAELVAILSTIFGEMLVASIVAGNSLFEVARGLVVSDVAPRLNGNSSISPPSSSLALGVLGRDGRRSEVSDGEGGRGVGGRP